VTPKDSASKYLESLKKPPLSQITIRTVTGTVIPLPEVVQASEKRIGLVFFPQNGQSYQISFQALAVAPAFLVGQNQTPVELWLWRHGSIVTNPMYGSSVSSFANITVLEVFDPTAYLDSPLPPTPWDFEY
jgi:hypothetical protein